MVYLLHVENNNFSVISSREGLITTSDISYFTSESNFLNQHIISATSHVIGSSSNPKLNAEISISLPSKVAIWHIYGKITKNINTPVAYYQITSIGPSNDPTTIIPANPYSETDIVDTCLIEDASFLNNNTLIFYVIPVKNDTTSDSSSIYNYDFTIDYYQM